MFAEEEEAASNSVSVAIHSSFSTDQRRGWSPMCNVVNPPSGRGYATTVVRGDKLFMFGGSAGSSRKNDLHVLDFETRVWSELTNVGNQPPGRNSHAAILYDPWLYVFGGWDGTANCDDLYRIDLSTPSCKWQQLSSTGQGPCCRRGHSAVILESIMYVLGGWDGVRNFSDLYALSLPPLSSSSSSSSSSKSPSTLREDLLIMDPPESGTKREHHWQIVAAVGVSPTGRRGHTSVVHQKSIYVLGGQDGSTYFNDLFQFDIHSSMWSAVQFCGCPPAPRSYHTSTVHGNNMFVFGGTGMSWCFFNDVYLFGFETKCWTPVRCSGGVPSARCFHAAALYQDRLFILGGARLKSDSWEYYDHMYQFALGSTENDDTVPPSALSDDFSSILDQKEYSDIQFVVQGTAIHAHKAILCARSPYFKAMFRSGMKEHHAESIVIDDCSPKVFLAMLRFLYTDKVDISPDIAVDLMQLSSQYNIERLKAIVESYTQRNIDIENVAAIIAAADRHSALPLKRACLDFLLKEFNRVIVTENFIHLAAANPELMKEILSSASLHMDFSFR